MNTKTPLKQRWQIELANAITDPAELIHLLQLDPDLIPLAQKVSTQFTLRVPRNFVAKMRLGDPLDPLLQQVLPLATELTVTPHYSTDPLQEQQANPLPGLLHKYPSRVLLTLVGTCAINCRYCFRRHFPYEENTPGKQGWQSFINYIANDPRITEVILSGGDPLLAPDKMLADLMKQLLTLPQVKTLRIHTRLPIVLPERITDSLLYLLQSVPLRLVIVTHANHAQELDQTVNIALQKLKRAGITLLNQSVLLRGINDNTQALSDLSETLFDCGVLPYYLHMLDHVQGTAHFAVSDEAAQKLCGALAEKLPGYLVPKLVREEPQARCKIQLNPIYGK